VLLTAGRADPIAPVENTERLAALLHDYGARVEVAWQPGGHQLLTREITAAESFGHRLTSKAYQNTTAPELD
jgi:phospholipase/carboxylesterase